MKFSPTTGGFYHPDVSKNIPEDAVEITAGEHAALLQGQAAGQVIVPGPGGRPELADRPPITGEQVAAAVTAARSMAYTRESDPLFFKWQRGEATKEEWLAKVEEIRERYPDGVLPK